MSYRQSSESGTGDRFPALDAIRGFAALGIVLTHAGFASGRSLDSDLLAAILGRLDFGVAVFFLLSGFLLYRPFVLHSFGLTTRPSIRHYLRRRMLRIFPALWLTVVVTLGLISTRHVPASDWLHYLSLAQVYDHHEVDPNLTQLWTLSTEVGFYILLPLIGWVVGRHANGHQLTVRRHLAVLAGLVTIAFAFNIAQAHLLRHAQAQLWLPAYLDWFALGMLLAALSVIGVGEFAPRLTRVPHEWARTPATCWTVAVLCWLLTTTQLGTPRNLSIAIFWQWTLQHVLFGAAAFFLLLPLVLSDGGPVGRWWTAGIGLRLGRLLGDLSYSVFLWHLPLLLLIQRSLGYAAFSGHFTELATVTMTVSIATAAASWYAFERPIMRYAAGGRSGGGRPPSTTRQSATTHSS